jgi:hypothetical protein
MLHFTYKPAQFWYGSIRQQNAKEERAVAVLADHPGFKPYTKSDTGE